MDCQFNVPMDTILVQIVDGIRANPALSQENKNQAVKGVEMVIKAFRTPQTITGSGGVTRS